MAWLGPYLALESGWRIIWAELSGKLVAVVLVDGKIEAQPICARPMLRGRVTWVPGPAGRRRAAKFQVACAHPK